MTNKGSDQTARMRRLIGGFVGRTYHIVGNLMSLLNSFNINNEPLTVLQYIVVQKVRKLNDLQKDWQKVGGLCTNSTAQFLHTRFSNMV